MKISRKANTVGALMIAAGAVVTGASVTSGAMAAGDSGAADTVNAVVVGTASADGTGDAYQCVFDDLELPTPELVELPASPEGVAIPVDGVAVPVEGAVDADGSVSGATVAGGDGQSPAGTPTESFAVSVGEDGTVTVDGRPVDPATVEIGEAIAVGAVSVDASGAVVMATGELPEGGEIAAEISEMTELSEVREGTAEECATLLQDVQASPATAPAALPAP